MVSQRPVARLAIYVSMFSVCLGFSNVTMALFAGLMSGKLDRPGGHLIDRRTAIVSILPEGLGHNKMTNYQKDKKGDNKEPCKSEKMSCILK